MSVPNASENRLFRNQMDQFFSEVPTEDTPRQRKASHLAENRKQPEKYDFHVVEVTKPILTVSYLCENGMETHLAREPFLKCGDRREPLIKRNGVYFVKAACVRARDSQNHAYDQKINKIGAYEQEIHKSGADQLKIHNTHVYELKILKIHAYELKILKS